ncbi:alpha/beta hydrolase fold domain-containing protein [Flavobacterium sp.]|uniref:alpha/beta hydrolase fold domain-containing protein n=1 Tax=Flavobacterium sp. TaxID=239 RepID=UPI0039E32220
MSKKYFLLLLAVVLWNCSSDDSKNETVVLPAQTLSNVHYGPDDQQIIDIYLPEGRNAFTTKVLIMVHGGAWIGGSKDDMTAGIAFARLQFPDFAIVNVEYRLATAESPAYPKQINDIQSVIEHLVDHSGDYAISKNYAFLGISAGAHLSMLYAYNFDPEHRVKAVCSIVGPTDFNDPAYVGTELETTYFPYLAGPDPSAETVTEVSPISHVDANDPPTIQFLGNLDPLVPPSQGTRLESALNTAGIANQRFTYEAAHGNFTFAQSQDINSKLALFLAAHF